MRFCEHHITSIYVPINIRINIYILYTNSPALLRRRYVQFNIISLSVALALSIRLSLLRDVPRPTEPEMTATAQYLPVRVLHIIIIMRQKTVMIIL